MYLPSDIIQGWKQRKRKEKVEKDAKRQPSSLFRFLSQITISLFKQMTKIITKELEYLLFYTLWTISFYGNKNGKKKAHLMIKSYHQPRINNLKGIVGLMGTVS